jgi:hypothetical protein
MRLSDEKARQLTWLVWRDRARRLLPLVGAGIILLAIVTFVTGKQIERADPTVQVHAHDATVVEAKRIASRGAAVLHVDLDDGRDVDAVSLFRIPPTTGAHVIVNEVRHASGKLSYDVTRLAE